MIGQSIGGYRIVAKLGAGGMGAVYLGEHQRIARKVAIKVLLPELSTNQQIVARFFNEARATSLIRHPGIVEVTDCDVLPNGNAFIVMELLEGESLGSFLRRDERTSVHRAVFLVRCMAEALAAAHEQGIVHRDLKPDNVFLLRGGGAPSAQPLKILDFGIAKLMDKSAGEGNPKTKTGGLLGTPVYMSPEQCRGVGAVDHRTDIYSLGCILFELICGRPPFTSEGFGELIQSHLSIAPPTLKSLDDNVPDPVDALVTRMLAKEPGDRPQTMHGLVEEFDAAISGAQEVTASVRRQAGGTLLLESAPRPNVQTTLKSAAVEGPPTGHARVDGAASKPRRGRLALGGAVVALAIVAIGAWRASVRPPPPVSDDEKAAPVSPPAPPVPEPSPPAARALTPPPTTTPVVAPPPPAPSRPPAPTEARERPQVQTPRARIVIASDPPGADVCLAKDRILIGRTKLEWTPEKTSRSLKLMIRKRGYRGEEITVDTGDDAKKKVSLNKLGPDDIDDTDTCRRR